MSERTSYPSGAGQGATRPRQPPADALSRAWVDGVARVTAVWPLIALLLWDTGREDNREDEEQDEDDRGGDLQIADDQTGDGQPTPLRVAIGLVDLVEREMAEDDPNQPDAQQRADQTGDGHAAGRPRRR